MNRDEYMKLEAAAKAEQLDTAKAAGMDKQLELNMQGKTEEAFALSEQLYAKYEQDDRIAFNHGWHLVRRGDLAGGFRMLSRGRNARVFGSPYPPTHAPMFDAKVQGLDELAGKHVIWFNEGGLGDELLFLRFAHKLHLHGAKVIVGCHASLASLISRIPWVDATFDISHAGGCGIFHSYWIPAMSSPALLDVTSEELERLVPYCTYTANPKHLAKWGKLFSGKAGHKRIGIRWAGNPQFEHEQHRTYPIKDLLAKLNKNDLIVNFQIDQSKAALTPDMHPNIFDAAGHIESWDDTAAALKQIDVLVTSCTSLAHLAGSMGVKTLVIVPCLPYYPWVGNADSTPWYGDNVSICRQTVYGNWDKPIERVLQHIWLT